MENDKILWKVYCGLKTRTGERIDPNLPIRAADRFFPDGYTLYRANGRWKGENEETLIFEILVPWGAGNNIVEFARALCAVAIQESILVTCVTLRDNFLVSLKESWGND